MCVLPCMELTVAPEEIDSCKRTFYIFFLFNLNIQVTYDIVSTITVSIVIYRLY